MVDRNHPWGSIGDVGYNVLVSQLKYHLGLVILNACFSANAEAWFKSSNGLFYGVDGILNPGFPDWAANAWMFWPSMSKLKPKKMPHGPEKFSWPARADQIIHPGEEGTDEF
jgi:hypothetical protein